MVGSIRPYRTCTLISLSLRWFVSSFSWFSKTSYNNIVFGSCFLVRVSMVEWPVRCCGYWSSCSANASWCADNNPPSTRILVSKTETFWSMAKIEDAVVEVVCNNRNRSTERANSVVLSNTNNVSKLSIKVNAGIRTKSNVQGTQEMGHISP